MRCRANLKHNPEVAASYEGDQDVQQHFVSATQCPSSDFAMTKGILCYKGRIYVVIHIQLCQILIESLHDSLVGGHSRVHGTYQRIKALFY
ncbi:hypothetical protein V2J09_006700 [Rumex salicifolius]